MYGTRSGWLRAHSGDIMDGMLVVIIALTLPKLNLGDTARAWVAWVAWVAWGFIYIAWSFTVFYWLVNASRNRGLSLSPSALAEPDVIGWMAFPPVLPSMVLVLILLFIGAKGVMSSGRE